MKLEHFLELNQLNQLTYNTDVKVELNPDIVRIFYKGKLVDAITEMNYDLIKSHLSRYLPFEELDRRLLSLHFDKHLDSYTLNHRGYRIVVKTRNKRIHSVKLSEGSNSIDLGFQSFYQIKLLINLLEL